MVLLNGPVQNAWFCFMDQYRNVCVWFMARNFRFPKVGTLCCQRGNHRLPLQGTASSQRLELLVPNLGTRGYHCKQLPVPRGWNSRFPTWEPQGTIARNFRFPEVGTLCCQLGTHRLPLQGSAVSQRMELGSQPGNQRLPLQATAGSQRLELSVANVGTTGYHCKELPVPRGWNSWFPTWEPEVTIASNCRFQEVGTHASQPGNHRLPLQGTSGSQNLNSWFPTWEPQVTIARNCRFPEVGTLGSQPGNQGLPLEATVKMI